MEFSGTVPRRPVSRRGESHKTVAVASTQFAGMTSGESPSPLGMLRPGTSYRGASAAARPPSSLRGGTASRLTTTMTTAGGAPPTANSHRIGTAIGYAGNMMSERPITQHGLSGLPSAQARYGTATGMRQIKDKRYWHAQLQLKMNEIIRETDKLSKERDTMDREKSAKRTVERKVKEAAKDLTALQSQLTDMNIVLDSHSTGLTRQQLQQETIVLRERNETIQAELENLFSERQSKTERNKELETQIAKEKNKINEMIYALSPDEQQQYHQLQELSEQLRQQNVEMHDQIEVIIKQKDRLEANIMSSQPRMEAVRLLSKLNELVIKRNGLRDEEANRLSPAQEREKLINEVRSNNQALTSMNRQIKLLEDQLSDRRELIGQIEQDLEEGNSERHAKYKELKRRDETMTAFMETFREAMLEETQTMETLKNQITYAIEQITMQGINLKSYGISRASMMYDKNDLSSHDGLLREYKRLGIQLKQLQILEKRTADQLKELRREESTVSEEILKFTNLNMLREDAAIKMDELTTQLEELKKKERSTDNVVEEARKRNADVKEQLRSNDTYRQISHLEERLTDLIKENQVLESSLDQIKRQFDYSELKRQAEQQLNDLMELLRAENSTTGL